MVDLPLRPLEPADFPLANLRPVPDVSEAEAAGAGLVRRAGAFAADAATVVLIWSAAMLVAGTVVGALPGPAAFGWSAGFILLLSFFETVPALILFGKTVGMAVAGLATQPAAAGRRLAAAEAVYRWMGTVLTAATLGTILLWSTRSPQSPTPADRFSGRVLVEDESRA